MRGRYVADIGFVTPLHPLSLSWDLGYNVMEVPRGGSVALSSRHNGVAESEDGGNER